MKAISKKTTGPNPRMSVKKGIREKEGEKGTEK